MTNVSSLDQIEDIFFEYLTKDNLTFSEDFSGNFPQYFADLPNKDLISDCKCRKTAKK